jgi:hypothetical protein
LVSADGNFITFVETRLGDNFNEYYKAFHPEKVEEVYNQPLRRKDRVPVSDDKPAFKLPFNPARTRPVTSILTPKRNVLGRPTGQYEWSRARKNHPAPVPFSRQRAVEPYKVDLTYLDPDQGINELWSDKGKSKEEREQFKEDLRFGTELFKWEMSAAAAASDEEVITWYFANDRGVVCPEALMCYSPTTGEAYFDLWTRNRHLAETRTRSKIQTRLEEIDGTRERDKFFRE